MVLVDTSVWISHLREGNARLADLLNDGMVLCHAFVLGELACGNLKERSTILSYLELLPTSIEAEDKEVLSFIEDKRLMGKGLGYVDIHLLASVLLTGVSLWTLDKKLIRAADSLNINRFDRNWRLRSY
jgi:predicted nucleic acid-binding protein